MQLSWRRLSNPRTNKKWDAVLVEAGEQGGEFGVLLAQRYEKKGILKKRNHPVGNPALVSKPAFKGLAGQVLTRVSLTERIAAEMASHKLNW